LKKSVPKGDNKRKKAVAAEIDKITAELADKHKRELDEWKAAQPPLTAEGSGGAAEDDEEVMRMVACCFRKRERLGCSGRTGDKQAYAARSVHDAHSPAAAAAG
jgi:hypothetical protein